MIKAMMKKKGATQAEAANALGVDQGFLSKMASRKESIPEEIVARMAAYFGVESILIELWTRCRDEDFRGIIERYPGKLGGMIRMLRAARAKVDAKGGVE